MTTDAPRSDGRRDWLLAIDTATTRAIVAAGALDGTTLGVTTWLVGRTHGEQLLPAIGRLHGEANLRRSRIRGVIVGTGPGAFTGLRVGIATAKALAHELGVPIVGISTGEALLVAAGPDEADGGETRRVLLLPAGPNDRLAVRSGGPAVLLPGGTEPELALGEALIAVDLDGRAPAEAVVLGELARDGLAEALVRLGAGRLAAGDVDDLARLVPEYVSLPRGVRAETGEVAWSRDHR
jgi:tRNA threonylcarbamoyl adenosine modification protein YeaZ